MIWQKLQQNLHPGLENQDPHTAFHTILPQEEKKRDGVCLGYSDNFVAASPWVKQT